MAYKIIIAGIGKKQPAFVEMVDHYRTMLRPFAEVTTLMLKSPHAAHTDDIVLLRQREAELLRKQIAPRAASVALTEQGAQMDSAGFARWIGERMRSHPSLVFLIGGAYGLDPRLVKDCDQRLSLSPLTFSHLLCPVLLLEQLYRAFTILTGHPYHK